ncbi:hypothetical protein MJ904_19660 [Massilia sp. MB5]|uniref:hypothetical protein n=1 Tax=Massilia sp. MB5 TaxID=2919578 RepID=UPI001F0DE6E8|nr:hypothetical protein [Massilia sp. MB5]UMR29279.1 hypothetical protein MJ904_19660 [Massilia sp. MB5]
MLNGPLRHLVVFDDDEDRSMQTRVSIGADGLQVQQEPSPALQAALDGETSRSGRLMEKAEAVAESGVRISTDLDAESRTAQTAIGVSLILGGILLCLLSIVVTRYTVIGIRRYIEMNFSLLRGR